MKNSPAQSCEGGSDLQFKCESISTNLNSIINCVGDYNITLRFLLK